MCLWTTLAVSTGGAGMEPRSTPGAATPSAAPRLIPQQTLELPLDQPWIDRQEEACGADDRTGGFFYLSRMH